MLGKLSIALTQVGRSSNAESLIPKPVPLAQHTIPSWLKGFVLPLCGLF